jgi:5'-3' exonuclease
MKPKDTLSVAIHDADNIPFVVCYNKKGHDEKTLEECISLADNMVNELNRVTGANRYILCFTHSKRTFRNELNAEYKANRKKAVVIPHSREVRSYLMKQYNSLFNPMYEADDLVLSLNKVIPNSFIISADKDILNTEGYRFNPRVHKWVYTSAYDERIAFWRSMITGDTADNIKGIVGKGPAFAQKVLEEESDINCLAGRIMNEYIKIYGEKDGIGQFNKNYECLRIVDDLYGTAGNPVELLPELREVMEPSSVGESELQSKISEEERILGRSERQADLD